MTILCCSTYDREILRELELEDFMLDDSMFDIRKDFFHMPNLSAREFLTNAIAAGHLPSQRSPHDKLTVTDTEIHLQQEWLDEQSCREWIHMRQVAALPYMISIEMQIV